MAFVVYIVVSNLIVLYKSEYGKEKGNEILIGGHCMLTNLTSTDDPLCGRIYPCTDCGLLGRRVLQPKRGYINEKWESK